MEKQHKKGAQLVLLHLHRHLCYGNCGVCVVHMFLIMHDADTVSWISK